MSENNEDVEDILVIIDTYVDAHALVRYSDGLLTEGLATEEKAEEAREAAVVARKAMIEALRALADPRTCA